MIAYLADGLQLRPAPVYSIRPIDAYLDSRKYVTLRDEEQRESLVK
jgi:hypothetical protein